MGFALQFTSTEDEGTRECIVENNKACTTGATTCSTKECEVLSEYVDRATASWTGKTLRDATVDARLTKVELAASSGSSATVEIDSLTEGTLYTTSTIGRRGSYKFSSVPPKYRGLMFFRGDDS